MLQQLAIVRKWNHNNDFRNFVADNLDNVNEMQLALDNAALQTKPAPSALRLFFTNYENKPSPLTDGFDLAVQMVKASTNAGNQIPTKSDNNGNQDKRAADDGQLHKGNTETNDDSNNTNNCKNVYKHGYNARFDTGMA